MTEIRITETNAERLTFRRIVEPADIARPGTESIHCRACGEEIIEALPTWHTCSEGKAIDDDEGDVE